MINDIKGISFSFMQSVNKKVVLPKKNHSDLDKG